VDDSSERGMLYEGDLIEDILIGEILQVLNNDIPIPMRRDFILLQSGQTVVKHRRAKLLEKIEEILIEHGYREEAEKIKCGGESSNRRGRQ
jgi:hypothetical protein